jgi:RNA polymerase sigma-70 factor (ECF subfamily)
MADAISALLSQVGLGNRPAFGQLYDLTSAKLFGVCLRLLRDRAEAEDALQEVFIKIWHNAARFQQAEASPMAWLVAIARNQAIDKLRQRRAPALDLDEAFEVMDEGPGPEALAMAGDEKAKIDHCLEQLPQDRAEAVRAAYVEGYSYLELATRFGLPLNTLRTWLRRSLLSLRECLES